MASPHPEQGADSNVSTDVKQNDEGKKAGPISFGFSKTISKAKSGKEEERDFLIEVEGKELKSTKPVEKPTELIIPLIRKNRWYKDDAKPSDKEDSKNNATEQEEDSVESQAVKELIEESRKQQDQWENGDQADPNLAIPLLMQNQAPGGFEDGDHINVDLRPESSSDVDYERVPVEAYGMAMLRGMGWKEGEGIGRTFKQDVKPIEHQLRPKGLGLGADRSAIKDLEPGKPKRPPKPGEERKEEEEQLVLGPGGFVLVELGAHKDLYGKIEGVDPDNARVMVKLAIGGKTVTISQHSLRLVTRKEYDKFSKDLSRLGKAHKEKEKEKERAREKEKEKEKERAREQEQLKEEESVWNGKDDRARDRLSERDRDRDRDRGKDRDRDRDRDRDDRKRKHQESSLDRDKPPPQKESRVAPPTPAWLQRDLRVRFIDKTFKGGRYYNSKMRVEDVLTHYTCVCRTEDGRLLDDVKQTMLETIVPKGDTDYIMVVLGQQKGQVGRILKRDKDKCRAMVQLDRYEEQVFTLDYDSICHYVGGVDH